MLLQTVEQIKPLLNLLQQPAFCIQDDGGILCNRAALHLAPPDRERLASWLNAAAPLYEDWNRRDSLNLALTVAGCAYSVTVQALQDGELFLMSACGGAENADASLAVVAQVLRQPLTDLFSLSHSLFAGLEEIEDPTLQPQAAAITQHLYRLIRITSNLADLQQLRNGQYALRLAQVELNDFLSPLLEDLSALCASAGRTLKYTLPREQVHFSADTSLLERAILNLLSNAIKYGDAETPIRFWAEVRSSVLFLRVRNDCRDADSDLLSAAFRRMEQRGVLPDPRWGAGLGLPLVQHIAQLHGGSAALEAGQDGSVTVTMSLSRKHPPQDALLKSPPAWDYTGGIHRGLVELSDVLPAKCYDSTAI